MTLKNISVSMRIVVSAVGIVTALTGGKALADFTNANRLPEKSQEPSCKN
ncbi:MAG: hypothetical protein WD425_00280 [Nitrospirales bacterium]